MVSEDAQHNSRFKSFFHSNAFIPMLCFVVSFLIYLKTLCPTVFWADSGELTTAIYTLGIAHPTGTPLYILIGRLFLLLPFGSVAYRINIMSAFFASLSVALLYLITNHLFKSRLTAFISAICLAVTPAFWAYSIVAEVYTLNMFLFTLNIYLLLLYRRGWNKTFLYIFSFTYGLSLTNHPSSILLCLPFAYGILVKKQISLFSIEWNSDIKNIKLLSLMALFFIIGLMPYLYIPIRSKMNPVLDWGDPETLPRLITYLTGREYLNTLLGNARWFTYLLAFFIFCYIEYPVFIFLFFIGAYALLRHGNRLLEILFFLAIEICYVIFNLSYNIPDILTFYLPVLAIISIFIGGGAGFIIAKIRDRKIRVAFGVAFAICLLLVSINHNPGLDKSSDYSAEQYSNHILNLVENNTIILTNGDEHSVLFYAQLVEGKRADVIISPLSCIVDQYCIQELLHNHRVIITTNFTVPVTKAQVVAFVQIASPRKVYLLGINGKPKADNSSTWTIYPLTEENLAKLSNTR